MSKHTTLAIVVVLIIASIIYIESKKTHPTSDNTPVVTVVVPNLDATTTTVTSVAHTNKRAGFLTLAEKAKKYELAKEITTPDGFINTDGVPIKISDYVGKKVILVDFWTYSCINCQRTVPYLEAWYEKYRDEGLVVVGIHTPEFEFEKDFTNVKNGVAHLGITFPVVLDNDYSTWNAYGNHYWPHKYLIDIDGYIVHDHIGEGGYDVTEKEIQDALKERKAVLGTRDTISGGVVTPAGAKTIETLSPETYFGFSRNEYLGNGSVGIGGVQTFAIPSTIDTNKLYLGGTWDVQSEFAKTTSDTAEIMYRYNAKNIYVVAHAASPVEVEIIEDGVSKGSITISDAKLYTIAEHATAGVHTIDLKVTGKGLEAFTFTFG